MMRRYSFVLLAFAWFVDVCLAQTPTAADIALRVQVGRIPCELGVVVELQADPKAESQFTLKLGKEIFQLRPVPTSTGVIRLEDSKSGAVWLQIANKSMLMNQKVGRRLADECATPVQAAAAMALKANPVPSLLDQPTRAVPMVVAPVQVLPAQALGALVQTRAGPLQTRDGPVQTRAGSVQPQAAQSPMPMPAASSTIKAAAE